MIIELLETKKIVSNFDKTILESPYKVEYISAKSNISLPTLYRKIRENKFTIDEILVILEIIQPEQYQFEMLSQNIKIAEEQFRNGEFITEEDFVFDVDAIIANRK
jgi:predicted transcriptional regulator